MTVFRAWPYLYEGSLDYERDYLARYDAASTGTLIVAFDGERIVGASSALALAEEFDYVRPPGTAKACRSEEHTSELQSLMRISYAVLCLKKKKQHICQIMLTKNHKY